MKYVDMMLDCAHLTVSRETQRVATIPATWLSLLKVPNREREREIFIDNLLVRVHLIIEMSRPALRHGNLSFLFRVALYLPSS